MTIGETHKTATTGVLPVLADTTVTGRNVTPLFPVLVSTGRLVELSPGESDGRLAERKVRVGESGNER